MRLLVDNDVLVKAAHWNLIDWVPPVADADWPATAGLEAIKYRARRADPKLFRDVGAAALLSDRLERCAQLPEPDPVIVSALQGIPNLDVGEIQLIGVLAATPDAILLTGDKRALRALASPTHVSVIDRVGGRILCLEQWLWFVHERLDGKTLADCVRAHAGMDTAARCVVGSREAPSPGHVREGLASYLRDLDRNAPRTLARRLGLD
ncbi:MAG: hypothetical protein KA144_00355 [Xanthomonadaceae bacterium]|nr:hypothetical protein [Xanthomonadaceae bacterium]